MIIECPYCEARVDGQVISLNVDPIDENGLPPFRVSLLKCPTCHNSLISGQYQSGKDRWEQPSRLWPSPQKHISFHIPPIVSISLEEANSCFKARAYSACAVMCGRALEGICRSLKTKSPYLAKGLGELRDRGIIDARLMRWAEELQKSRNIGAHASNEKVSKQDANDLLDFVNAICEYVFVLTHQFDTYIERKKKVTKR
jgi:hypothetical protein